MRLKPITSIFLLFLGSAIILSWVLIWIKGQSEEPLLQLGFHLFSEALLSLCCFLAGIRLLRGQKGGYALSLAALAMLIYSLLNAAGYYAHQGQLLIAGIFALLFFISAFLFLRILQLVLRKIG